MPPELSAVVVSKDDQHCLAPTRLDHLLQTPIGINLHSIQVVEAIDFRGVFAKLLRERIGEVVGRVR